MERVHLVGPGAPCEVLVFPRWLRGEVGSTFLFFLFLGLALKLLLLRVLLVLVVLVVLTDEHQSSVVDKVDMVSLSPPGVTPGVGGGSMAPVVSISSSGSSSLRRFSS